MRVSTVAVICVLICIVLQNVESGKMNFKTLGEIGNSSTGGNGTNTYPPTDNRTNSTNSTIGGGGLLNNTGPGTNNTGPGGNTTGGEPSKSPTMVQAPTRSPSDGTSGTPTASPSLNTGCLGSSTTICSGTDRPKEYTNGTLSNYTTVDENANKTDTSDTTITQTTQRQVESTTGYDFYFTGDAGLMKIQAPDSTDFVSVKFRKLADSDGQKAENFENASWTWVGPTSTTRQGLQCSVLTATGNVTIDTLDGSRATATFFVEVLTFNETGKFEYGNATLYVDSTSAKISYTITGWPFAKASGSELYLAVTVNSNGNGITTSTSGSGIVVGKASISAPTFAYVDDVATKIDLYYSLDSSDSTGCQGRILMVFPQFSDRLYYDPVVSPTEVSTGSTTNTNTTSSKGAMTASFSFITALFAVFLMMAF